MNRKHAQDTPTVDAETIDAARRGDREARGRLLHALQDVWYRLCLGLLGNAETARDATQETALRFLRRIDGFRGDSQIRTWSLGIAINVAREMRRRRGRELSGGDDFSMDRPDAADADGTGPDWAAERSERSERLHAVLADLPERQREAVVLRFFENMSVEQTADVMGCAEGTVKATVHQALRSMRQRLQQLA